MKCHNSHLIISFDLLFATGGRVSQIANLKINDLNLKTGRMNIRGKGGKELIAYNICNLGTVKIQHAYLDVFQRPNR